MKLPLPYANYERVVIHPGEYHVTTSKAIISTILGSCVACCLYDEVRKIIGMNHFMLSNRRYSRDLPLYASEAGRYGINAMELLINGMMKAGAERKELKAKIFGGAAVLANPAKVGNFCCVGEVNSRFIRDFLSDEGIPIVAADLGGHLGRVIYFSNGDFTVNRRRISNRATILVSRRYQERWCKEVAEHEQPSDINLWGIGL